MPAPPDVPAGRPAGPVRAVLVCFLPFAAAYFIGYLFRTVNAVVGPDLVAALGLDAADLGLLTSAYFLSFAVFQLPLGMLLDRHGPRRVEAALLLVAALGAVVFGLADDLAGLTLGRALIGLGVSGCLMAAIKANVQFWPPERLPFLNGLILAFGALGATAAALPVEWMLQVSDWRAVFFVLAVPTVAAAAAIHLAVPESHGRGRTSLAELASGLAAIYRSPRFWRLAPSSVAAQAAFLAYQTLWAGPWLRDVALLDRGAVAAWLSAMFAAMIPSYVLGGLVAGRLMGRGLAPETVFAIFIGTFLAVQAPLAFNPTAGSGWFWLAYGVAGTGTIHSYALLTHGFAAAVAGRVNTALNVLVFSGAFLAQYGVGAVINLFPAAGGGFSAGGHQAAFAILFALQLAALAWLLRPRRAAAIDTVPGPR